MRSRLIQFAGPFARRINPALPQGLIQQAAAETIAVLPPPEYGPASVENRDLQLVFRHDCLCASPFMRKCVFASTRQQTVECTP